MWKHIYDKLGGHPGNTSAATCTRRIYEKCVIALCGNLLTRFRSAIAKVRGTHAEQYAQTKTNTNPSPDPNRYRRRCPDPIARIQKFIHYMAMCFPSFLNVMYVFFYGPMMPEINLS